MKILWICNIMLPKIAIARGESIINSGGWLTGLSEDLLRCNDIELTVCFPYNSTGVISGNVDALKYYGFPKKNCDVNAFNYILNAVGPDIIHIFGTEYAHSLKVVNACEKAGLINKTIISIQGFVSIYAKHFFAGLPQRIIHSWTLRDIIRRGNIRIGQKNFEKRGRDEIAAIEKVKHVIGRTDWDFAVTKFVNKDIKYHFCNETLRSSFYEEKWDIEKCEKHSIFVSQCSYPIKGFHHMLEAMIDILKFFPDAHLHTTGRDLLNLSFMEKMKLTSYQRYLLKLIKRYGLKEKVTFWGSLDEKSMCKRFLSANVFVSCSSIENSPNSLGEAMLLGVPSVSSYVGGVANMMVHNEEGFVYQPDAPYMLAHYVCKIFENQELALEISKNARKHALCTHDKNKNTEQLIKIYSELI